MNNIHPFDKDYLADVQVETGVCFYVGCTARRDFKGIEDFAAAFANSKVAHGIEVGHLHYLAGTCGIEWYGEMLAELGRHYAYEEMRKQKYVQNDMFWCGYVLAYYQWERNKKYLEILKPGVLTKLLHAYEPLHSMEFVPIEAARFLDRITE